MVMVDRDRAHLAPPVSSTLVGQAVATAALVMAGTALGVWAQARWTRIWRSRRHRGA